MELFLQAMVRNRGTLELKAFTPEQRAKRVEKTLRWRKNLRAAMRKDVETVRKIVLVPGSRTARDSQPAAR